MILIELAIMEQVSPAPAPDPSSSSWTQPHGHGCQEDHHTALSYHHHHHENEKLKCRNFLNTSQEMLSGIVFVTRKGSSTLEF